jgi:hypothetical protein
MMLHPPAPLLSLPLLTPFPTLFNIFLSPHFSTLFPFPTLSSCSLCNAQATRTLQQQFGTCGTSHSQYRVLLVTLVPLGLCVSHLMVDTWPCLNLQTSFTSTTLNQGLNRQVIPPPPSFPLLLPEIGLVWKVKRESPHHPYG